MFKTIVLGLDASEQSDGAVAQVEQLATLVGSRVIAVHVIEHVAGRGAPLLHVNESEILAKVDRQVEALRDAGIEVEIQICSSMLETPAHEIANVAIARGADLIVTGTRSHATVTGAFVGSVSHGLVHLARCPLLVVPAKAAIPAVDLADAAVASAGNAG